VTKSHLDKLQLREQIEQLSTIIELSSQGVVSFDRQRRVQYVNCAFLNMTGAVAGDVLGSDEETFSAWLQARCAGHANFPGVRILRGLLRVAAKGRSDPSEGRQLIELLSPHDTVLEVSLCESRSDAVPLILYFCDVTRETELNRRRGEFINTAGHELRTPLASIYGFSELMLNEEFSAEDRNEFLGAIYRQSELMLSIINDVVELSKIEVGRGKNFKFGREDAGKLIRNFAAGFNTPSGRNALDVSQKEVVRWILADQKMLTKALGNVVSNAYKFSSPDGKVSIEIVEPEENDHGGLVGLRVYDQGSGMSPEVVKRVGDRFFRADTSGKLPGAGLGMSIVKEIVDMHAGHLSITSSLGVGTTVTLWLPAEGTMPATSTLAVADLR